MTKVIIPETAVKLIKVESSSPIKVVVDSPSPAKLTVLGTPGPRGPQGPAGPAGNSGVYFGSGQTGGTNTAYTLSATGLLSLASPAVVFVELDQTNGEDPTININDLGALPIKLPLGTVPPAGVLTAGVPYQMIVNATEARIVYGY